MELKGTHFKATASCMHMNNLSKVYRKQPLITGHRFEYMKYGWRRLDRTKALLVYSVGFVINTTTNHKKLIILRESVRECVYAFSCI